MSRAATATALDERFAMSARARLAAGGLLREQGGLMATLVRRRPQPSASGGRRRPARRSAAQGPRARGQREEYELLVEAIYEGYLLHYGAPRVVRPPEADLGLLAGDRLYAIGLARLVALGDTEAVAELADTITLSALAQAPASRRWPRPSGRRARAPSAGDPARPTARAKELAFAAAPEAIEAMRTSAAGLSASP